MGRWHPRALLTRAFRSLRLRRGRPYLDRAHLHRDRSEWIEAVLNYRRALEFLPWREDLHIQVGNCLKEYGDYGAAAAAYRRVTDGANRPEALKQIADANRRAGGGILPYATAERPDEAPAVVGGAERRLAVTAAELPNRLRIESTGSRRWLGSLGIDGAGRAARGNSHPSIVFDQVGAMALMREGATEPLFAGVVAIRVRIASVARLDSVELWLGEGDAAQPIRTAPVQPVDRASPSIRLHVANIWLDSATLPPGRHWLAVRAGAHAPPAGMFVNICSADAVPPELPGANGYVPSPPGGADDPDRAIVAAPAEIRPAARSLFDRPIRSLLVMRTDQLGDVSASLPAMARLRALFPAAQLTVLVQPGVKPVIEASGFADEVMTVALDYRVETERRFLDPAEEARLRAACAARSFDLAIDLSPADEVRPLMLLTGATYLVGFNSDRFTFLDFGIALRSRDKANQLDIVSQAAVVMTLVEALAVVLAPARPPVPRTAPTADALAPFGLTPGSHVVLHTGARHAINRWPTAKFAALAGRLLDETDLRIVLFAEAGAPDIPAALRGNDRVAVLDVIDADAFDAIVSTARLMVGNDSGPKHLAAARGVPTVSVHVGRLNWNEWGQDGSGTIVSKRVPCTGCGLNDIRLCGRDAVCVRAITVDEVLAAARGLL